jgi:2-phospho-L-lactate guanylyltransferase
VPAPTVEDRPTAVVPIRSFRDSKSRLAGTLDESARSALLRASAGRVVSALADGPVLVVSDDDEVRSWAAEFGVGSLAPGVPGLDRAATTAREHLRSSGVRRMMIVHADIWSPDSARSVAALAEIVIVPDLALDGTNVLVLPTVGDFDFAYGPGSFRRHLTGASRLATAVGASLCVRRDRSLGHDIDTPDDLHHPLTGPIDPERGVTT